MIQYNTIQHLIAYYNFKVPGWQLQITSLSISLSLYISFNVLIFSFVVGWMAGTENFSISLFFYFSLCVSFSPSLIDLIPLFFVSLLANPVWDSILFIELLLRHINIFFMLLSSNLNCTWNMCGSLNAFFHNLYLVDAFFDILFL